MKDKIRDELVKQWCCKCEHYDFWSRECTADQGICSAIYNALSCTLLKPSRFVEKSEGSCDYVKTEKTEKSEGSCNYVKTETTEKSESSCNYVNRPPHYVSDKGIEVIDIIEAFTSDLVGIEAVDAGNIIKYICRWKHKNGLQDLEKASWYLNHLIKHVKSIKN